MTQALPPLPEPSIEGWAEGAVRAEHVTGFTADQMRTYALAALSAQPQGALTDEQCEEIVQALDGWAKNVDAYEYGLPIYGDGIREEPYEIIRKAVAAARKDHP